MKTSVILRVLLCLGTVWCHPAVAEAGGAGQDVRAAIAAKHNALLGELYGCVLVARHLRYAGSKALWADYVATARGEGDFFIELCRLHAPKGGQFRVEHRASFARDGVTYRYLKDGTYMITQEEDVRPLEGHVSHDPYALFTQYWASSVSYLLRNGTFLGEERPGVYAFESKSTVANLRDVVRVRPVDQHTVPVSFARVRLDDGMVEVSANAGPEWAEFSSGMSLPKTWVVENSNPGEPVIRHEWEILDVVPMEGTPESALWRWKRGAEVANVLTGKKGRIAESEPEACDEEPWHLTDLLSSSGCVEFEGVSEEERIGELVGRLKVYLAEAESEGVEDAEEAQ